MVALWGRYGAVAAGTLGIGSTVVVWPNWSDRFMGVYAVVVAILMGAVFRRLAVQLAATHRALSAMAYRDPLTGAANRRLFYRRASKTLAAPSAPHCGVLSIGLNRFKAINDSLGHTVGDELLRHVAARVQQVIPKGATFARLGGDEFAVFLPDVPHKEAAHRLAKLIVARLRDRFHVGNHSIHVGARVGVAVNTDRSHDLDPLIRAAEAARNRAKERGKSVDELSWQGSERVSERLVVEVELRSALSRSELEVYFQPVVRTADGTLVGAEALVRWNHVRRGPVAPSEIIAIAEESGLIAELDRHVCDVALGRLHRWLRAGWDGWVAVNLAAPSFSNPELPRDIKHSLLDADVAPERLVVEITESRAMRDPEASASTVHQLKALGVGVAIDDFGIGYSSLAYLKMFPVDHIKIDRYFVQGIGLDDRDEHLIEVVTELARKRGIAVLAEGIETDEQLAWLRSRGCAFVQGFLVGRPVPADEFERRWLGAEGVHSRSHVAG
jgi:diguanylate cyclase (GGDEF)-like protein